MKTRIFWLSTFLLTLFFGTSAFAQVDLDVALSVSPTTVVPNGDVTLTATVENIGTEQPGDAINEVVFYRSVDTQIDANDTRLGSVYTFALSTGGSSEARFLVSAPPDPGTYYYGVSVQVGTTVFDYSDAVTLRVTGSQPNLTITLANPYTYNPIYNPIYDPYGYYNPITPGGTFTLNATVQNVGDGQSAETSLTVEYRATPTSGWTPVTPISIQPSVVPILAPNTSRVHTVTLMAPIAPILSAPLASGTYDYRVYVTPVANESDLTDNYSAHVSIRTSWGDLVVDAPTVNKSTVAPGETFTLTATVRNNGIGNSSGTTTLQYYRSTDSNITTADTPLGAGDSIGILSGTNTANQGYPNTITQTVEMTAPTTPGIYYYGACVSNPYEIRSDNNCSTAVAVTVSAPASDLVAELFELRGSGTLAPGDRFTLDATVRNEGDGRSAATTLRFYESTDRRFRGEDEVDRVSVGALAGDRATHLGVRLLAPSEPGTYYYRVHVDPVANESVTHNNWSGYIVIFVEAPVVMESLRASKSTLSAGERFTLTATVENEGRTASSRTTVEFYRSADNQITSRDTSLGAKTVGTIAARQTSQVSHTLTAPNTAGDYYYGACVGDETGSDACAVIKVTVVAVLISEFQRPPIYWVNAGTLERLIGSNIQNFVPSADNVKGIALDLTNNKIYWAEQTGNRTGRIRRANINGTRVELVKNLTSVPRGLTIDTVNKRLYLTNAWGKVQRMNLDGTGFKPDLVVNLTSPTGIAVDPASNTVYWIEQTGNMTGRLSRADLDGTDVDLVKVLTSTPHGLTIDTVNRKLYLTNGWGKVQRMNLNGSKFEPNLIVNLDAPRGVAIDAAARKIYWTEKNQIRRANFNGRSIQTVASGLGSPVSIVLDGLLPEPPRAVPPNVAAAPAAAAAIPKATALHANYPNPFNPETWIPYQLATAADVIVTIYDLRGVVVRRLDLGHQVAGVYQRRSRAAYWDGRNSLGEPVASGLYFYTLTAGEFTATRKLLIRK